jgi:hypothetical protein
VQRERYDCKGNDNSTDKPPLQYRLHDSYYRGRAVSFAALLGEGPRKFLNTGDTGIHRVDLCLDRSLFR